MDDTSLPSMYTDLAEWWPLLSPPEDYTEEAAVFAAFFEDHADGPVKTVLELGCGGGNVASHLKNRFKLTLCDLSPAMLAVSRALNPHCEHLEGDMRTLRLGRVFDAVLIHDAACYLTMPEDLAAAMQTAREHCRVGGVVIFAPDETAESFMEMTAHGGSDGPERGARYLRWTHDPDPEDCTYQMDFAYLLRLGDGHIESRHDQHTCGLFSESLWVAELEKLGFEVFPLRDHWGRAIFLGRRLIG